MIAASLVGGLNLGVAFMGTADHAAPSEAPRQSTVGPDRRTAPGDRFRIPPDRLLCRDPRAQVTAQAAPRKVPMCGS